ncbi:MAG: STAS domain-containing protein [Chloroflexi bacterium]|nr:STAS domain-containing protein [Chloroflexota bacterium]MBU1750721.1 STAS domain-containing protein [Chloroflexota bacterium]MBU1878093.1 STAS domain-containing protein [Chloroflexota bacterium]
MTTMRIGNLVQRLITVPVLDPDDARRRRLLNILLLGVLISLAIGLVVTVLFDVMEPDPIEGILALYVSIPLTFLGVAITLLINHADRPWAGQLASALFLLLLLMLAAFVDETREVVNGRSLVWFVIPVFSASILLRPATSFVLAAASCLTITALALPAQLMPNPYAMLVFFAIALIAWLSARGLERALAQARHQARDAADKGTALQQVTEELQLTVNRQARLLEVVQELEIPVMPLLPGLIMLPLVGHVDTHRAQQISQTLLSSIHDQRARVVIMDLTGLQLADSAMIQSLGQIAQGARLMGAQMIFSGIGTDLAITLAEQKIRLPGAMVHDLLAALQLAQESLDLPRA